MFRFCNLHTWGNLQRPINLQSGGLWNVGGNQRSQRKSTQVTYKLHTDNTRGRDLIRIWRCEAAALTLRLSRERKFRIYNWRSAKFLNSDSCKMYPINILGFAIAIYFSEPKCIILGISRALVILIQLTSFDPTLLMFCTMAPQQWRNHYYTTSSTRVTWKWGH